MHPFVALMRKYCIDYTNSHDQSLYDQIMEPDYVVHINGMVLDRDGGYTQAVKGIFAAAPGLGLVVHEFVLNGDRLCMHFSEHAAMPTADGRALTCWRGIGLYKWNGRRLTENYVEQDYLAMQAQLDSGQPHPLKSPHLDPWMATQPVVADSAAEAVVRAWIEKGDLAAAPSYEIDETRTGVEYEPLLEPERVTINDLFSAGPDVAFHATIHGTYRGGLGTAVSAHVGRRAPLHVAGIAFVSGGEVMSHRTVTARLQTLSELSGTNPLAS